MRSAQAADVIVVGAGPGGSAAACYLAQAGREVLVLEKADFPREKVCGDGLTPRAVRELVAMGVDIGGPGWFRTVGLRVFGAGMRLELPWPDLSAYPDFGLVRTRRDLDRTLARTAQRAGARLLERTTVTAPVIDERTGRIAGVRASATGSAAGGDEVVYRAPVVIAADGAASRLSVGMSVRRRADRPVGVAVRRYFHSRRHDDRYLEAWLDLRAGRRLLPGYGWVFGVGDGTSNVGVVLLDSSARLRAANCRALLERWLGSLPPGLGFAADQAAGPVLGAGLPMGFNRRPLSAAGLLLVGDAGGMINPISGEGIAYALEAGRLAADVVLQAFARPVAAQRDRVLRSYPGALREAHGGTFTVARGFARLMGRSPVLEAALRHGMASPALMRFGVRLLGNLTDPRGGDAADRIAHAITRVVPAS